MKVIKDLYILFLINYNKYIFFITIKINNLNYIFFLFINASIKNNNNVFF